MATTVIVLRFFMVFLSSSKQKAGKYVILKTYPTSKPQRHDSSLSYHVIFSIIQSLGDIQCPTVNIIEEGANE
jgi:hypothetical protein